MHTPTYGGYTPPPPQYQRKAQPPQYQRFSIGGGGAPTASGATLTVNMSKLVPVSSGSGGEPAVDRARPRATDGLPQSAWRIPNLDDAQVQLAYNERGARSIAELNGANLGAIVQMLAFFWEQAMYVLALVLSQAKHVVNHGTLGSVEHVGPSDAVALINLHQITDAPGSEQVGMVTLTTWCDRRCVDRGVE